MRVELITSSYRLQFIKASPVFNGSTHMLKISTCRNTLLKKQLALKRDSLTVEYAFCFSLKTPWVTINSTAFPGNFLVEKQATAETCLVRFPCHRAEGGLWGAFIWWMLLLNNYGFITDVATSQWHLLNAEVKAQKDEYKTGNYQNSHRQTNYPN